MPVDYQACRVRAAAMFLKELLPRRYAKLLHRDWPALKLAHLPRGRDGVFQLRKRQPPTVVVSIDFAERASDEELLSLVAHETLHACHYLAGHRWKGMDAEHALVDKELRAMGLGG